MRNKLILLLSGFTYIFFIGVNTIFFSKHLYIGVIVFSFIVGLIWTSNVKKIAVSNFNDRLIYSIGSSIGAFTALFCSDYIIKMFF